MNIDARELHEFAADLGRIASDALPAVDAVVKKGADNIKKEMVADAEASRHFSSKRGRSLSSSISYDSDYRIGQVAYEIGPDKSRGGELGVIAYFGGSNGGGGTLDIDAPLRSEEPRTLKALDEALGRLL